MLERVSFGKEVTQQHLDFLRGAAAFFVVLFHARGAFFIGTREWLANDPSPLRYAGAAALQLTQFGIECVVLFFVLSGFAMAHSIKHSRSTRRFYLKRVIRIWPPYLAATMLGFIVGIVIHAPDAGRNLLALAFYVDPRSTTTPQFWSLPYEVVFYVLCPFILATAPRVRWLFAVSIVFALAYVVLVSPIINQSNFIVNFLGVTLFFFGCGALAYHQLHHVPRLRPRTLGAVAVVLLALTWTIRAFVGDVSFWSNLPIVALAVLAIRNVPPRLAALKSINFGYFSYSIYIFHYALIALLAWAVRQWGIEPRAITNPFVWMIAVPPVLACCWLLYLVTEKPCNRIVASLRRPRH